MNPKISLTKNIPFPTYYVKALGGEYSNWAYDEERALNFKGEWCEKAFDLKPGTPLDLEIGTGNGLHFADYASRNPARNLLGIELKYKPLIQSIRRALNQNCKNARMIRYHANYVTDLFSTEELDNIFIYFPDPWEKKKSRHKNRLIQNDFLADLFRLQKQGSFVELKTDSRDYFDWIIEKFKASSYQITRLNYNLHSSEYAQENFKTAFEDIFLRKGLPIHYIQAQKK